MVNVLHPNWFALTAAVSSLSGCALIIVAVCALLWLTGWKKVPAWWRISGVAALLAASFGAYFSCELLRHDALRRVQFAPFFINDGISTRMVAGCGPRECTPVVISDWPWSERMYPPNTGAMNGTVKGGNGRAARGAIVYAVRDDVPTQAALPWAETDAEGHFDFHGLEFAHYGVTACNRLCNPRNWQAQVGFTLGPASRVKTIELRLLK
jgi:hypothetical protein